MKFFRGELAAAHPLFSKDSNAAIVSEAVPLALHSPHIEYNAEDDAAIDEYHKQNVETSWHSVRGSSKITCVYALTPSLLVHQLGTAAMKPREQGGVVDSRLNVYGTSNLKVAGMSYLCSTRPFR